MTDSIIESAKARLKSDKEYWGDNYQKARDDAKFMSDDPYAQWSEEDFNNRLSTGRPALTIDQLGQFIHQVANDIRINTPTISVIPTGLESSQEVAETYKGLIRAIEYKSNADNAYDTAVYDAIKQGIGFLRVETEYESEDSLNQELRIERVVNPLQCWIDAASTRIDGSDAMHATILDKIRVSEFKRLYPKFTPVCFENDSSLATPKDDEFITIAEFFEIVDEERTIGVDADGKVHEADGKKKLLKTRKTYKRKVMRYKLSGADVLESTVFPGKYIPIVPVYGEESWIDGKRHLFSLIRKSKGAQQMYNYWKSLETELLQKAPIAPIVAAEGQVEDYADDWRNPSKASVLRYKFTDAQGNAVGRPQRLEPPTIPTGIINASRGAVDDIKATMGIYNASLGMRSNEQSGVAIAQRKEEGDVATYHFGDNLIKAITHVGKIIISAAKEVYDTARIVMIVGSEDNPKMVGINGEIVEEQEDVIDLSRGEYDVRVVAGASYTTLRQEAAQSLQQLFAGNPEMMQIMGDLYFKYSDFAGADAMAERMKKMIDPKFLDEGEREDEADPEKMQLMQALQEMQANLQAMAQELEAAKAETQGKQAEVILKAQEVEIKRESLALDAQKAAKDFELREAQIQLEASKAQEAYQLKMAQIEADLAKARMDAKIAVGSDVAMLDADLNGGVSPVVQMIAGLAENMSAGLQAVAQNQAQSSQAVIDAITRPKRVLRDEKGNLVGVE